MEFVNSLADMARGAAELTVPPFLDRIVLRARDPLVISFPHHEFEEICDVSEMAALYGGQELMYRRFCFDPDTQVRRQVRAVLGRDAEAPDQDLAAAPHGRESLSRDQMAPSPRFN